MQFDPSLYSFKHNQGREGNIIITPDCREKTNFINFHASYSTPLTTSSQMVSPAILTEVTQKTSSWSIPMAYFMMKEEQWRELKT